MRTAIFGQKLQPKYKKLSPMPSSLLYFHTKLASYDNNCLVPQVKQATEDSLPKQSKEFTEDSSTKQSPDYFPTKDSKDYSPKSQSKDY